MRKNHHGKKDRLVKRVFALCLALAVICTCLVPVFATEGLIDPQVNQEASRPVDDGEASYPDDEFAGFGGDEAAGFGEPREVYDDSEAAGFGEDEVATRPVEGGEDNLDGGPNVKETEWGTVIEYGPSSSTGTDPEPETQWSGEDDVVEKPDDKVVVSGDEIKKLQDMVVYRFWLKELNTLDLQDITAQAQINNMTESEYLARNGEVLWNLYFIQAVPRAETIADYSSYINTPSSNRDPKGELRLFDYWYTLDEFGNRVRLNLTDPTSNILDDKTTTVNVYAAWKDGTVGSDEEEDVDHEDLVDKNPVPVDLTAKASASYEDEDGNTKKVDLPVEVKNLPSAAHSLSVIHMGDDDMESFYKSHEDSFGEMMPILGLKISPKNAKGETVQPAKGDVATVTVSGLDALPEMEGATASTLKVFHETSDGNVEILDVLTYTNGTLTFETTSFSPFVLALTGGYDTETLETKTGYEPLYLYLLKPQYIWDGSQVSSNDYWYGIGIAQVKTSGYKDSSSATDIKNRINDQTLGGAIYLEPYNGTATITSPYSGWGPYTATYTGERLYPPIDPTTGKIVKDKDGNVVWDTTTGYRYWDGEGSEPTYKYYTIEWIHTAKVAGAPDNGYNTPTITGDYSSYHLDGRVHLSTMYNVDFKVKVPGSTTFEYLSDYSVLVKKGTSESVITLPQNNTNKPYNTNQYESQGYVFNGWYKDEACTIKAEFDGTIEKDTIYYGKYVPKDTIAEDSPYITVEKQITGIDRSQINYNFYVKVGDYVLPYQSATLVKQSNPITLRWTIPNAEAKSYHISEGNAEINGYTVTPGGDIDSDVDVTNAKFTVTQGTIYNSCNNLSLPVGRNENRDFLFVVSSNGKNGRNIVISKSALSLAQRDAVETVLNNASSTFANQNASTVFYSIKDQTEVVVDNVKLVYNATTGKVTINAQGVWNKAMELSYDITEGNNPEVKITNAYAPATANVTLTKHVTGLMGDTHKEFAFSITGLNNSGAMLENGGLSNFTLTHNGSVTLKNVPMDTVFAVVETLSTDSGYETKATGHDTAVTNADRTFYYKLVLENGEQKLMACDANGNEAKEQEGLAITVTNHCTLQPDLGVLLDTLPYIVILAVVAGGVALLMLRKHRKEDD